MVCGGHAGRDLDQCFRYNPKIRTWTESGRMSEGKHAHASSVHPEFGLVITGGLVALKPVDTVETTKDGKHFLRRGLPDLPLGLHGHCQVTVDADTIMVFGGCANRSGDCHSNVALKLDVAGKKWKHLPRMRAGRRGLSCGIVGERGQPKRIVAARRGARKRTAQGTPSRCSTWQH